MTVELLPPLDPSALAPPTSLHAPGTGLLTLTPLPPDPGPGDPDTPWSPPAPAVAAADLVLVIAEAGSHRPLTAVESAVVEDYDDPLTIDTLGHITASASAWDPCWEVIGAPSTTIDDLTVVDPDWRRYELQVWENGELVAAGYLDDPVTIGDDRISLNATGIALAFQRTIGDAGTSDDLGGAGSFEGASGDPIAWLRAHGWSINDGLEPTDGLLEARWNPYTPFSGSRSLQVRGKGVLRAPVIPVAQHEHFARERVTTAMVQHTESYIVAETEVYADGATQINKDQTRAKGAATNEDDETWQNVASSGILPRGTGVSFIRMAFRIYSITGWVDIDEVRYPKDGFTGSRSPIDRAYYPSRIVDRLEATTNPDGQALGLSVHVDALTGSLGQLAWEDYEDVRAVDMLSQVNDTIFGADVWVLPNFQVRVAPRRGSNRTDLALNNDTVLRPSWETNPGAIIDQLRVLTPWGTGPGRIGFAYDQPLPDGVRINRQIMTGPTNLSWLQLYIWGLWTAQQESREARYADLLVDEAFGRQVVTGDGLPVALSSGRHGWVGWVRVANRKFTKAARTCTLTVGLDPAVTP
ncbi:hypothetical protein KSP35_13020 [Aquihabitans sp. G128]|uniref:hypothetical protein n=1 Tax=Aquihabitans sp. G128 TaxID=2849779 RepID=UPI001C24A5A3|nr:hypothetical protein [Aquihabitans sp. G128]QXC59324.1 hypothetical protein KSP35_13020 [Aquihabitans sp. G128]